jgi:hypothetical protein
VGIAADDTRYLRQLRFLDLPPLRLAQEKNAGGTVVHRAVGFFFGGSLTHHICSLEQLPPPVVTAFEKIDVACFD